MNKKLMLFAAAAILLAAFSTARLQASGCSGDCGNNNNYDSSQSLEKHGSVLNGNPVGFTYVATVPALNYHAACCEMYPSYSQDDTQHGHQ